MPRLVAGFDMKIDKILLLQCFQCCRGLSFVVGVVESRGTLHHDHLQPGINADAPDQVDGRDYRTALYRVYLVEWSHLWPVTGRPGPDAVGRMLPLRHTFFVQRMVGQQLL